MRAVLCVVALLALSAAVDVSARRIHKLKQQLVEAEDIDADLASALPFDGAYWDSVKPDFTKALAAESKKAQLPNYDILNHFFAPENVQLAQQQGANVVATIGAYTAAAFTKKCNEGTCDDKWAEWVINAQYNKGGAGNVVLTCTVPNDLKTTVCNVDFVFDDGRSTLFSCSNIGGGAAKKCTNPRPTRYSTGSGTWLYDDVIINTAAPGSAVSDVYFTIDAQTVNFRFFGLDNAKKLTFTAFYVQTANWKFYKPVVSPAVPAPAPELVKAEKASKLSTQQLLDKFFTKDNIQLAQMQGSTTPVRATIAAFTATAVSRSCNVGVCNAYAAYDMNSQYFKGGEGSVVLSCSVPADLSQSKCNIDFLFDGKTSTLMSCPDIGNGGKCTNPRPTRYSTGSGTWLYNDFITTTTEVAEVLFTNDDLVVHFRYRGIDSSKRLVFSDFTAISTPFADFGFAAKTNCLSKTTSDAVMQAAAAKQGLKNPIVLQKPAVDLLIKSAPYHTVEDAVTAIKGIGPRNVVYVSFMWNFQC